MNYLNLYHKFIESRMNRPLCIDLRYEHHHILPRCFDGPDHPTNMIYLTRKEHYIAHLILQKAFPEIQELYWPLQFFTDVMSEGSWKIFCKQRSQFRKLQDRSYLKELWFLKQQSIITTKLWANEKFKENMLQLRQEVTYQTKQSKQQKIVWRDRNRNEKDSTNGRFPSRSVNVDGKIFLSLTEAAKAHNISVKTAYNRAKKETWPTWYYC